MLYDFRPVCMTQYRNKCVPYTDQECREEFRDECQTLYRDNCFDDFREADEPYEDQECKDELVRVSEKGWVEQVQDSLVLL